MHAIQLSNLIEPHKTFINTTINQLSLDSRILGISLAGSIATGSADQFSDIDFVISVDPNSYDEVLEDKVNIVSSIALFLTGFTGEHVGDKRLLICLYDSPLLHVDFKFVSLNDVPNETSNSCLIWQRDTRFGEALSKIRVIPQSIDFQWIEDRFWIWIHYVGTKVARGEKFEVLEFLSFIRTNVLVPLGLFEAGQSGFGVRKLEFLAPEFAQELKETVASYDQKSLESAVKSCIRIYINLRTKIKAKGLHHHLDCQKATMDFIDSIFGSGG
ncbi:MAG: oxalate:formate antiporter [Candidatus Cloacimonadota bacterium]|nr:MAG: oxalate:formate antiporter [Candidatus Cloacimonadota bacterium]